MGVGVAIQAIYRSPMQYITMKTRALNKKVKLRTKAKLWTKAKLLSSSFRKRLSHKGHSSWATEIGTDETTKKQPLQLQRKQGQQRQRLSNAASPKVFLDNNSVEVPDQVLVKEELLQRSSPTQPS